MSVLCPECETPVILDPDEIEEGDTIPCEECGADLEILSLDPLKIATVEDSGYDDPEEPLFSADEDEEDED